jgi:hypothetical protein
MMFCGACASLDLQDSDADDDRISMFEGGHAVSI